MTFQELYNVTEKEQEALRDRVEKMILGEVTMNAEIKAAEAVAGLMALTHFDDADTVTIQWRIQQSMGLYKTMIGEIRNEAPKDNRGSGKN